MIIIEYITNSNNKRKSQQQQRTSSMLRSAARLPLLLCDLCTLHPQLHELSTRHALCCCIAAVALFSQRKGTTRVEEGVGVPGVPQLANEGRGRSVLPLAICAKMVSNCTTDDASMQTNQHRQTTTQHTHKHKAQQRTRKLSRRSCCRAAASASDSFASHRPGAPVRACSFERRLRTHFGIGVQFQVL